MNYFLSGKYKRTVHPLVENTEDGVGKLRDELQELHEAFKDVVLRNRGLRVQSIDRISTGEAWFASDSMNKGLGLVDELMTSSEYLHRKMKTHDVIRIRRATKKKSVYSLVWKYLLAAEAMLSEATDLSGLRDLLVRPLLPAARL